MSEGTCAHAGYTYLDGHKNINVPVLGDIDIALYSKSGGLLAGDVTLYKIVEGECGEATVNSAYEKYAEEFAGLSEGSCKTEGYTVLDGTKDMKVPVVGDVKISLYSKATEVEKYVQKFGYHDPLVRHHRKFLKFIHRSLKHSVHTLTNMI